MFKNHNGDLFCRGFRQFPSFCIVNIMEIDVIPYLSKELTMLGIKPLPYTCRKTTYPEEKIEHVKNKESADEFSDDDSKNSGLNIVFDNKSMLISLISACMELAKQVKSFEAFDNLTSLTRLQSENETLSDNFKKSNEMVSKVNKELSHQMEKFDRLNMKNGCLVSKIKFLEQNIKKNKMENETTQSQLKSEIKRLEKQSNKYHSLLYKKFNLIDVDYVAEHLETLPNTDPDFRKLWNQCASGNLSKRERALKEVICRLQDNCDQLRHDSLSLKSLTIFVLDQLHDLSLMIAEKLGVETHFKEKIDLRKSFLFSNRNIKTFIEDTFEILRNILEFCELPSSKS